MKKILFYAFFLLSAGLLLQGCEEDNYPGGTISPYIPIYDLRSLYKGGEVVLSPDNMFGSTKLAAVVVSDHSGGNLPAGLLVVQDKRRLGELRGISIPIGDAAANYFPGDSVHIDINGGVLKRVGGLLEVTGVSPQKITKVKSGIVIPPNRVGSSFIYANPEKYESTLVAIVKGTINPVPAETDQLSGEKFVNDGFGDMLLHTESSAKFSTLSNLPFNANYYGIIFTKEGANGVLEPEHRVRTAADIVVIPSDTKISPIIITGFIADVAGADGNYEYMQFKATQDINFATTPYSVVVTNNAGATNPTGFPTQGWATGALATTGASRTFKINLTSGTVSKGEFFYVGGSAKMINGPSSTSIAGAKWIRAFNYTTTNGDGFGIKTGGLFANSGNASGFAVFAGTTVTVDSTPIDVLFIGAGGSLYNQRLPAQGYRIANNDYYDIVDPITLVPQPFYRSGSNTLNYAYNPADLGYFYKLGGTYDATLGKWVKARTQTNLLLTKTSSLAEIEGEGATTLK